jgi:hypothetical protein
MTTNPIQRPIGCPILCDQDTLHFIYYIESQYYEHDCFLYDFKFVHYIELGPREYCQAN